MVWAATADNGGTPVTAYEVWFNQGPITNTFVKYSTVSPSTLTETITTVTSGDPYIIRIVAVNRLASSACLSMSLMGAGNNGSGLTVPARAP